MEGKTFRFETYVPEENVEEVKKALAEAGAGRLGNYDYCMWQTLGTGQFRPLEGSNPAIGKHNVVEHVKEVKLEMIVSEEYIKDVIAALKKSHPYETPAFQYWPVFIN